MNEEELEKQHIKRMNRIKDIFAWFIIFSIPIVFIIKYCYESLK